MTRHGSSQRLTSGATQNNPGCARSVTYPAQHAVPRRNPATLSNPALLRSAVIAPWASPVCAVATLPFPSTPIPSAAIRRAAARPLATRPATAALTGVGKTLAGRLLGAAPLSAAAPHAPSLGPSPRRWQPPAVSPARVNLAYTHPSASDPIATHKPAPPTRTLDALLAVRPAAAYSPKRNAPWP